MTKRGRPKGKRSYKKKDGDVRKLVDEIKGLVGTMHSLYVVQLKDIRADLIRACGRLHEAKKYKTKAVREEDTEE